MPLTSHIIIRQAYVRIGAFTGDAAQISTDYAGSLANLNTESFPLQSMYDMLVLTEQEMAWAVGNNENSTYRELLADTVGVNSGDAVPDVGDGTGMPIIGVWGQVREAGSGTELVPGLHEDEIRALGSSTIFTLGYFSYAYKPPRVYASRPSLEIDVCVYDFTARAADIAADGAMLFQNCEGAYFAGLMSRLKNEDPLLQSLSDQFAGAYQAWLESLRNSPRGLVQEAAA